MPWVFYFEPKRDEENFLSPGRVWSDTTGKIYDVKTEEC